MASIKFLKISEVGGVDNPLLNFDQDFINKLQSISTLDLAQCVPYIALSVVDLEGNTVIDYNIDFFQKQIDMEKISEDIRYSDRPEISLKGLSINTSLEAGIYGFSKVVLDLKIHRLNENVGNSLSAFLFPGAPLRLGYGWAGPIELEETLTKKKIINVNVKDYKININNLGEADLTVERTYD